MKLMAPEAFAKLLEDLKRTPEELGGVHPICPLCKVHRDVEVALTYVDRGKWTCGNCREKVNVVKRPTPFEQLMMTPEELGDVHPTCITCKLVKRIDMELSYVDGGWMCPNCGMKIKVNKNNALPKDVDPFA